MVLLLQRAEQSTDNTPRHHAANSPFYDKHFVHSATPLITRLLSVTAGIWRKIRPPLVCLRDLQIELFKKKKIKKDRGGNKRVVMVIFCQCQTDFWDKVLSLIVLHVRASQRCQESSRASPSDIPLMENGVNVTICSIRFTSLGTFIYMANKAKHVCF